LSLRFNWLALIIRRIPAVITLKPMDNPLKIGAINRVIVPIPIAGPADQLDVPGHHSDDPGVQSDGRDQPID
jgi:hypothetical protein